ncbi:DUF3888 domain-containing protein [Anaerosolibacter sp.]|uniref:DUF3888 domain-containing protein n=1 Tax=Anaerosolibacter sp. TaxID=1872527 RepID=UPI0039F0B89B
MKKLVIFLVFIMVIGVGNVSAQTKPKHKHDSKGMEQVMDHFMLEQFHAEIFQAVKDHYKKDSVGIQFNWWDKNYDVVEIEQWEKGNELSHPFIVKFTVLPNGENKQLGIDTITFGVTPSDLYQEFDKKDIAAVKVELLNYKHRELNAIR